MSDTTTPADLTIPPEARAAFARQHRLPDPGDGFASAVDWAEVDADLLEVARPVVAAELRRLGDEIERRRHQVDADAWFDACNMAMDLFRARADELDGGAQ